MLSDRLFELAKAIEEKAVDVDVTGACSGQDFRDIKYDVLSLAEEIRAEEYAVAVADAKEVLGRA